MKIVRRLATGLAILPALANGLVVVAVILLADIISPLVRLACRRIHIKEARRLGIDQGQVLSQKMTGGHAAAPPALRVVSLRDGPWRAVLAAVTEQARAAGYQQGHPPYWMLPKRDPVYQKPGKMYLSILRVAAFVPGETISGCRAVVPEGQTGLAFDLQAHK